MLGETGEQLVTRIIHHAKSPVHPSEIPCSFNTASRMRTRITSWRVEKPRFLANSSRPSISAGLRRSQSRGFFMTEPQQARDRTTYEDRESRSGPSDHGPIRCISYSEDDVRDDPCQPAANVLRAV